MFVQQFLNYLDQHVLQQHKNQIPVNQIAFSVGCLV